MPVHVLKERVVCKPVGFVCSRVRVHLAAKVELKSLESHALVGNTSNGTTALINLILSS